MKKHVSFRLAIAGAFLLLSIFPSVSAYAAESEAAISTYNKDNKEKPAPQISLGPGYEGNYGLTTAPSETEAKAEAASEAVPAALPYETGEPDQYLGTFSASGYCNCQKCSGGHTHTYSGTIPQANRTIAADIELYPIGTKLLINGIVYTVEDKGGSVLGNKLDVFFATHEEALAFGVQEVEVYTVKPAAEPKKTEA